MSTFSLSDLLRHHPLPVFFALGGILYLLAPAPTSQAPLTISRARLAVARTSEARRIGLKTLPKSQQLEVDKHTVWNTLLAQEARRLGLDQDDYIVKRRLVQKMIFLTEHIATTQKPPSERTLRRFFQTQRQRWHLPATLDLFHIFFAQQPPPTRWQSLRHKAQQATTHTPHKPPALGDAFALGQSLRGRTLSALSSLLGAPFVAKLKPLPLHRWSQPIRSRFGWHLVYIHKRTKARTPRYNEVQSEVKALFLTQRKQRAVHRLLRTLYRRYRPQIAGYPPNTFRPKLSPPTARPPSTRKLQ